MNIKVRVILLLFVLCFYNWVGTKATEPYIQYSQDGWYNILSDGFLSGHLYFPIEPKPELLLLKDPYEPSLNTSFRLHDMSLYKDKYYMYFGPVAAIFLYIPYRLVTGNKLQDVNVIIFFLFGSFLFGTLILLLLKKKYFNNLPSWIMNVSIIILGLSNVAPLLLRRPMMYEVSISSGLFFCTGALFFFIASLNCTKHLWLKLMLGSLFLGLAAGCRPHYILAGIILPLLLAVKILDTKDKKHTILCLSSILIPYLICLFLLALYNYFRFENIFEFGASYQLAGFNSRIIKTISLKFILPGLYFFFIQPFTVNQKLPFVFFNPSLPLRLDPKEVYPFESVAGVFSSTPFILLIFIAPILFWIVMLLNCKKSCFKNKVVWYAILVTLSLSIMFQLLEAIPQPFSWTNQSIVVPEVFKEIALIFSIKRLFFIMILTSILFWLNKSKVVCDKACLVDVSFPRVECLIILLVASSITGGILIHCGATQRYEADFMTFLILLTCSIWFYFYLKLKNNFIAKIILSTVAIYTGMVSIICGMSFATQAYFMKLSIENTIEYNRIESAYSLLWDLNYILVSAWASSWQSVINLFK